MEIRLASLEDLALYELFAGQAQAWLQTQGLEQYVPAAHVQNREMFRTRVMEKTLYAVLIEEDPQAFFYLDGRPSPWWPAEDVHAFYLGGIVVSRAARGLGIGLIIVAWASARAQELGRQAIRLDCHSGNP